MAHCRDWFRLSHKEYRNFTKMSAKRQQNQSTPRIQAAFGSNICIIQLAEDTIIESDEDIKRGNIILY